MRRFLQSVWVKGKIVDIWGKYKSWQLLVHLKNCSYRRYRLSCIFISILDRFQKYLPQPFALPCCLSAWPSFEVGREEAAAESRRSVGLFPGNWDFPPISFFLLSNRPNLPISGEDTSLAWQTYNLCSAKVAYSDHSFFPVVLYVVPFFSRQFSSAFSLCTQMKTGLKMKETTYREEGMIWICYFCGAQIIMSAPSPGDFHANYKVLLRMSSHHWGHWARWLYTRILL